MCIYIYIHICAHIYIYIYIYIASLHTARSTRIQSTVKGHAEGNTSNGSRIREPSV